MSVLKLENITKSFGGVSVLKNVNLELEKGAIYTLIGGNGSGKTTLINIISGFLTPDSGKILYEDKEILQLNPYKLNRLGIGRTFQNLRLAKGMTVYENILLATEKNIFSMPCNEQKRVISETLDTLSLLIEKNKLADNISYGQQKLLSLACCIASNANLLLLDEPIAGVDKENVSKIVELITIQKNKGKTILQIEHKDDYINSTSDYIFKLKNGTICCK